MGIQKLSKGVMKRYEALNIDPYELAEKSFVSSLVYYVIDSQYRISVTLTKWLNEQIDSISNEIVAIANKIPDRVEADLQIIEILKWVRKNLRYTPDSTQWSRIEHWATADITLETKRGDCEDGSVLMYILARIKGISANRLYIWAGDVKKAPTAPLGGHACLFYKPDNYPFNYIPIDWCYYANNKSIVGRNLMFFKGKEVIEYNKYYNPKWSYYQRTWFLFNENKSFSRINPVSRLR